MSDDTKVRNVRIDFTDSHQESKGTVHGPVARLDHGTDRRNCLIQGGWDRAFGGNVERQGRDYREIFLICRDEPASGWRRETDFFQEVILGCVRRAHRPGNTQKSRRKIVFAAASQMFQRHSAKRMLVMRGQSHRNATDVAIYWFWARRGVRVSVGLWRT